jgi:predicted DNA-binding transcriptional regulator AlpA
VPAFELELVRFLRMRGVVRRVGLSRSTIDRLGALRRFSSPHSTVTGDGWLAHRGRRSLAR